MAQRLKAMVVGILLCNSAGVSAELLIHADSIEVVGLMSVYDGNVSMEIDHGPVVVTADKISQADDVHEYIGNVRIELPNVTIESERLTVWERNDVVHASTHTARVTATDGI